MDKWILFDEPYGVSGNGSYQDHKNAGGDRAKLAGVDLVIGNSEKTYKKPIKAPFTGWATHLTGGIAGEKYIVLTSGNMTVLLVHLHGFAGGDRQVKKGELIGYAGNTGWVIPAPTASIPWNGSHLHIELRINGVNSDPSSYIDFNNNLPVNNNSMSNVIGNTNQYTSLSLIARDLYKFSDWTSPTGWDKVLQINPHLRTGKYDNIPQNQPIYALNTSNEPIPTVAPSIIESAEYKQLQAKLIEAEQSKADALAVKEQFYNLKIDELKSKVSDLELTTEQTDKNYKARLEELSISREKEMNRVNSELANAKLALSQYEEARNIDVGIVEAVVMAVVEEQIEELGLKDKFYALLDRYIPSKTINKILRSNAAYFIFTSSTKIIALVETIQLPAEQKALIFGLGVVADLLKYGQKYIFTKADRNKDGVVDFNDASEELRNYVPKPTVK